MISQPWSSASRSARRWSCGRPCRPGPTPRRCGSGRTRVDAVAAGRAGEQPARLVRVARPWPARRCRRRRACGQLQHGRGTVAAGPTLPWTSHGNRARSRDGTTPIASNRRARHDYSVLDDGRGRPRAPGQRGQEPAPRAGAARRRLRPGQRRRAVAGGRAHRAVPVRQRCRRPRPRPPPQAAAAPRRDRPPAGPHRPGAPGAGPAAPVLPRRPGEGRARPRPRAARRATSARRSPSGTREREIERALGRQRKGIGSGVSGNALAGCACAST